MKLNFLKPKKNKLLLLLFTAAWLYILPILYQIIFVNNDNPQKVIAQIESNIANHENEFNAIAANQNALQLLSSKRYRLIDVEQYYKLKFSFQLYTPNGDSTFKLMYWNNNTVLPNTVDLLSTDGKYATTKDNGIYEFVKKTIIINGTTYILTGLLPIRLQYFIETDYLKKEFVAESGIEKKYTVSNEPTIYPIKNNDGTTLLYIKKVTDYRNTGFSMFFIICRFLFIIVALWFLYTMAALAMAQYSFNIVFIVFVISVLSLRGIGYFFNFPVNFNSIEYFDPRIYAADAVFKSLGDLSYNIVIAYVIVLFYIKYYKQKTYSNKYVPLFIDTIKIISFVVYTFFTVWLFRSLITASTISFNVTNFFSLNKYSFFGFVHIAFIVMLYYLVTCKVIVIQQVFKASKGIKYILIAIVGLLFLFLNLSWANDIICIWILLWMLLYAFCSNFLEHQKTTTYYNISLLWLVYFSVSASILFNYENKNKELTDRKYLAQKMAFKSDPNTENLLSIALSRFDNNFLSKNIGSFYNPSQSLQVKNKLLNENFVGYLNKFETKIYTYDSLEMPLYNMDSSNYQTFNAIIQNQGNRIANIPDLYYYETGFDLFRYIFKKTILDTSGKTLGYFIVQANPLSYKNKSTALSPELFKQRNSSITENGNNYIFAVYNKLELRKRFIDYDLPTTITSSDIPLTDDTIKYRNGYEELWYKLNKDSVVVVGKKTGIWIATITLFAYLFFALIVVTSLVSLLHLLFTGKVNKILLQQTFQLTFSKKVQVIVWVVSLVSFLIVGIVIISLFNTRFAKSNKERLSRTMSILIADVQNKLNKNSIFDDVVKVYEPMANTALKESIFQMSEIHNVDFNIYDLEGTLKLSSQPFIESKGILSNKINPLAFFYLSKKASAQLVQQESIGSFAYTSMYVPIRDESGKAYGYLNIPYYSSQIDLKQEISNFLITIINLNAFIFLIAGIFAWLVTNRITKSFELISEKMREVSLGKNEIIKWKNKDEIGGLVNEYNKMVQKLEESATELAKSERENAWREMARQVAHEIKNPLTPMKLSIQYLQKSIDNNKDNVKELATSVSKTLVEQIDHLSTIASDFSQFANIGNSKNEQFDIVPVIASLQLLFMVENSVVINLHNQAITTQIFADKTQINRLFTNLIKNALQAYTTNGIKTIDIDITTTTTQVVIAVKDYANGIPVSLQHKIFTPNFTTKTSGTGLGLAISKGIVENAKGSIYFTTNEYVGTTFYVNLPQS